MKRFLMLALCLEGRLAAADPLDRVFKSTLDGSEQAYVEMLPPGFDSTKAHDVVFAFHGHGSDRWQFIRDPRDECRGVRDVAAKFGLIVVSPDYRAKTSWMGPKAEADVLQIIAELKQRHKVGKIFLAGGSMGGTAALTFTALHPELIAGVCSLNGMANLVEYDQFQDAILESFGGGKAEVSEEYKKRSAELWPDRFTMPVAFTTGGQDTVVPPQSVLRLAAKLKADGRKVLSIHREAAGHATNYEDTCAAMKFMLTSASVTMNDANALRAARQRIVDNLEFLKSSAPDLRADAEVFQKGIAWALRYDTPLAPDDLPLVKKALARGTARADLLAANQMPWTAKKGRVENCYRFPKLPVTWTHEEIGIGEQKQPANNHAPVFIFPNPLAAGRYLVLNIGHTFHEQEFAAFNYLLFPRLGDWALMVITNGGEQWPPTSPTFPEEVVCAGYFDEAWQKPLILSS